MFTKMTAVFVTLFFSLKQQKKVYYFRTSLTVPVLMRSIMDIEHDYYTDHYFIYEKFYFVMFI